jgi:hypothetical protein
MQLYIGVYTGPAPFAEDAGEHRLEGVLTLALATGTGEGELPGLLRNSADELAGGTRNRPDAAINEGKNKLFC